MSDIDAFHKAIGFQTKTITSTGAEGITTVSSSGVEATKVTLTVLGANVRMRWDGTDPTNGIGHFLGAGLQFVLYGHTNLDQLRIIAESGTATLSVTIEAPE